MNIDFIVSRYFLKKEKKNWRLKFINMYKNRLAQFTSIKILQITQNMQIVKLHVH